MKTVADGISDRQWTAYRTGVGGGGGGGRGLSRNNLAGERERTHNVCV